MPLIPFGPNANKKTWILAGAVGLVIVLVAAWLLGAFGESVDSLAASSDRDDRLEAIRRISESDSSSSTDRLRRMAAHSDPATARMAVRSLGYHLSELNLDALRDILDDEKLSEAARSEAASTLGKFKEADPVVLTRTLSNNKEKPEVRAGAAKGLARLEMPKTIPQLSAALEDPSPEVRLWAITAIHRMIVRRFPYDPSKPPQQQKAVIERIRTYLRQCGVL